MEALTRFDDGGSMGEKLTARLQRATQRNANARGKGSSRQRSSLASAARLVPAERLPPTRDECQHNTLFRFRVYFQYLVTMSLRKLWLISIADRSVIYLKSFPIVEIQARHLGLPFLPAFRGHREEVEFIHSLFKGLGIDSFAALLQTHNRSSRSSRSSSLSSDTLSLDGVDFNESPDLDFDCSLSNQLPVVEMTFKDMKIWPVIVVEHGGILFCGLPLTEGPSRELIDHMSISMAFAALQAIIKQFTRENVSKVLFS